MLKIASHLLLSAESVRGRVCENDAERKRRHL